MKMLRDYAIEEGYNPTTIWCASQNHPELIVKDLKEEFNLNENQCEYVKWILLKRGVNKWLYARLLFIELKHDMKKLVGDLSYINDKKKKKELQKIYERMQNIAKMPRWVEWGRKHKDMRKNKEEIIVKGRHT